MKRLLSGALETRVRVADAEPAATGVNRNVSKAAEPGARVAGSGGDVTVKFAPRPQATVRLFCFPSAGSGAAMYRPWLELLPPQVELCAVQLPGRENRLREKPFASLAALVQAVLAALRPRMDRPRD